MTTASQTTSKRFPAPLSAWWNFRRKRFWLVSALPLYSLAGFLLAPWLVERQLRNFVEQTLGLELQLERLRINPWTLTVEARSLALQDGSELLAGFERLFVNLQTSSLYNRALTLDEVTLESPRVNTVLAQDGSLNLLALVPPPGEPEPSEVVTAPDANGSEPFPVLIHNLNIVAGSARLRDETLATPFEMEFGPIDILLNTLSTLPELAGDQVVTIVTENDAVLRLQGAIDLVPLRLAGRLDGNGNFLEYAHRYLQDRLNFDIQDSNLELGLDYEITLDEGFTASVTNIELALLGLTVEQQNPELGLLESIIVPALRISQAAMLWPENRLDVGAVVIEAPELTIWHDSGASLSIAQLLAPAEPATPDSQPAAGESDTDVATFQANIGRFAIENMGARIIDHGAGDAALEIQNLSLELQDLATAPDSVFPVALSGELVSGGQFDFSGQLAILPDLALEAELSVQNLALQAVQPWLSQVANLEITGGTLDTQTSIQIDAQQPLRISGALSLPGIGFLQTTSDEVLLRWEALSIDRFEFDLARNELNVDQISATSPFFRFAIAENGASNFQDILPDREPAVAPAEEATQPAQAAEPLMFTIGQVNIDNAAVDFSDQALQTPFATSISELTGSISTLSSTSVEPAAIDLTGNVGEFGLLEANGQVLPSAPADTTDITLVFRNIEMSDLTPYTVRFVGREIDSGRISMDLRYRIDQAQLDGQNEVVIEQLALGDRVEHPDATNLPLDLAVALLKRADGTIDINLPVSGDLSNPQFSISGIVFSAFANLITRAVAAPFNLLGSLVGAGADEDIGTIRFRAGEALLAGPEREKAGKLAEALNLRPDLLLNFSGVYATGSDTDALREALLQQEVEAGLAALPEGEATLIQRRRQVLEGLAPNRPGIDPVALQAQFTAPPAPDQPGTPAVLDEPAYLAELRRRLVETQPVPEGEIDRLARQRAEVIRSFLVNEGGVDATRISLLEPAAIEPDEEGWIPVEMALDT